MRETLKKLRKGVKITFGENSAVVTSHLMGFKDYYYVVADIRKNVNFNMPCAAVKMHDNLGLIIRNKELLHQMGLTAQERNAIYCHELGHVFSENQQDTVGKKQRKIKDEVDSDTFAVEKCGISPDILESALKKTYEYNIKVIKSKENMPKEKIERFIMEMQYRKRNIQRMISEKNTDELER